MSKELLLTIDEAARRLGMGRTFVYMKVLRGAIPSVKLGRSRRVLAAGLAEYVEQLAAQREEVA
jgi:excisionase family DNA binding protein